MIKPPPPPVLRPAASRRSALGLILGAPLAACSSMPSSLNSIFPGQGAGDQPPPGPSGPPQQPTAVGAGSVRVGLVLPLSGQGNAGLAAQSMKNAAELALEVAAGARPRQRQCGQDRQLQRRVGERAPVEFIGDEIGLADAERQAEHDTLADARERGVDAFVDRGEDLRQISARARA